MSDCEKKPESLTEQRDHIIVRTSAIGILINVLLAAFKAAVGLASHSIAIILDAVNNLSDAISSVVTIIGTKLAGKLPSIHGFVEKDCLWSWFLIWHTTWANANRGALLREFYNDERVLTLEDIKLETSLFQAETHN